MSKKIKRVTSLILCLIVLISAFPVTTVNAATNRDTSSGQWVSNVKVSISGSYKPDGSGYSTNAFKINGSTAYCLEPAKKSPGGDKVKLKFSFVGNENLKKAMYYYSGGGKNSKVFSFNGTKCTLNEYLEKTASYYWFKASGKNFLLIHYACAKLYGTSNWNYGLATNDWIKAVTSVANAISGAANAPSDFICYYAQTVDTSQQTLLFIPTSSITVNKIDSTNNKKLSGATFRVDWYENDSRYVSRYTKTTNSNGVISFSNLPPGKYRVTETKAPKGYAKAAPQYFTVNGNGGTSTVSNGNLTFKDNPYIKLQLIKSSANPDLTDGNDCYSLEGAKYNLYKDSACTGKVYGSITVDSNGYGRYINSNGDGGDTNTDTKDKNTVAYKASSGTSFAYDGVPYYCKEVTPPKGYELDKTVYQFKDSGSLSAAGVKIFRAYSTKDNSEPVDSPIDDPIGIVLQKRNAVTGETVNQGLEGAVFKIQYYAQEIDKNYDIDTSSKNSNPPILNESNLKRTWYIQTNDKGRALLTSDYLADNYSSDDFYLGKGGLPSLPIGTVVIEEVEASEGYTVSDVVFYRKLSEEVIANIKDTNTPIEVPIDEQPANGYVGIHKMNKSGVGVANAEYGLYSDSEATSPIATLITDDAGAGVFSTAIPIESTYYIKEIKAPAGYQLDTTVYPITVSLENTTIETAVIQDIYEDSIKGDIKIKKSSGDGVIKNFYFAVTDDMGNQYNAIVTDENGEATVTGLPVYNDDGAKIKYTVKELGFKVTPGKQSYGGYTWVVNASDCISYKGVYYEGIANAVYSNYGYPYSRYYYGDSSTASANANGYTKTLTENSTVTYEFVNTPQTIEIDINKNSFDNQKSEIWFRVEDQFGNYYGTIRTDENGHASLTNINSSRPLLSCIPIPNSAIAIPIKYKIIEFGYINPGVGNYYFPDKYIEPFVSELKSADIKKSKGNITFEAYNSADTGSIDIVKSSDDGIVADLCFEVAAYEDDTEYSGEMIPAVMGYDSEGNQIKSIIITTDENGYATTKNTMIYDCNGEPLGGIPVFLFELNDFELTYIVTELGFDNGDGTYTLPKRYKENEPAKFTLIENRNMTYDCHNTTKNSNLQILKTSDDDIVDGFWFNVRCDEASINTNIVTDSSGYSDVLENLPVYKNKADTLLTYTVTELGIRNYDENDNWDGTYNIPDRYVTPRAKKITLNDNAEDNNVTFLNVHNQLKKGSVKLYKQDSSGYELSGSVWELHKSTDNSVVSLIQNGDGQYFLPSSDGDGRITSLATNSNGLLCITNLSYGDYYLVETKAPANHLLLGRKIEFTISADTLNVNLTAKDGRSILPNTGSIGVVQIYIVGIALAIAAIIFIILHFRNKKKKENLKNEK